MILSGGRAVDVAPQSLGETTPTLSNGFFYAGNGLSLSGKFATYAALYRAQPAIATLVDKVANSAARLTLKVWEQAGPGKVEDSSSAFAKLIARPSDFVSPFNFWRWTFSTYEVYGEAFWYKQRDSSGRVIGLLPMHPSRTIVKRKDDGSTVYIFSTGGVGSAGILEAPAEDVVPFQRYNPDSLMRGMSRLEPLRSTLLNEDAARRATASWWQRGARPSVALKHPGELSEGAQARLKANWESRHAGADLMGGTAVLEEGMEAQIIQLTADEMQYIESRKMNLQECCMVFDVPPPVVHILDHATFSNITEQMRSMYRDTMAPRLEDIESAIDFHLRSEFYPDASHVVKFALDEVLRGDFETRAVATATLIGNGVMKPSEARPLFDLPDAGAVADKLYANAALQELGKPAERVSLTESGTATPAQQQVLDEESAAAAAAADAPKNGGEPMRRRTQAVAARSLLGNVGRVAAANGDVLAALVKEYGRHIDAPDLRPMVEKALADHSLDDSFDDIAEAWARDVLDERETA